MSDTACAKPLHEYFSAWALNQMFAHVISKWDGLISRQQVVVVCPSCGLVDILPTHLCQCGMNLEPESMNVAVKGWTEDEKHALRGKCQSYMAGTSLV